MNELIHVFTTHYIITGDLIALTILDIIIALLPGTTITIKSVRNNHD